MGDSSDNHDSTWTSKTKDIEKSNEATSGIRPVMMKEALRSSSPASIHRSSSDDTSDKETNPKSGVAVEEADEKQAESDNGQQDTNTITDPNIVDWDGPDDPENPMNWSSRRRWGAVMMVSAISFVTPLASSMFAPGVPELMKDFGSNNSELSSFVVSVFLLGFCFGPLVVGPLSELYGRTILYNVSNVLFLIFSIACAVSTNIGMFIAFRFLHGCVGVTPLTIGSGTLADIVPVESRGRAMALWALGPLLGPVIAPVIGGYLTSKTSWRWIFYLLAIIGGVILVPSFLLLRETYAPVLLERKAKRLRKETGNPNLRSKMDAGLPPSAFFKRAIIRPTKMLFRSPIVFLLGLHVSIVYSYLYLLFTTVTFVFEDQYGFTSGEAGLTFLGLGIGMFGGMILIGWLSDSLVQKKKAANNGVLKPEYRLPPLIIGAVTIPIGLFWYGWSADKHVFWLVPILGTCWVGLGLIATFMPVQNYVIDAYPVYAASASAALTVVRSLFGALVPLAGQSMYKALGLGWGNSLLAFVALVLLPVPFLFMQYGERIRTSPRFQIVL